MEIKSTIEDRSERTEYSTSEKPILKYVFKSKNSVEMHMKSKIALVAYAME